MGHGCGKLRPAGLFALQGGEPGQVWKEAATAIDCECRRQGSPFSLLSRKGMVVDVFNDELHVFHAIVAIDRQMIGSVNTFS